jgi:hypothetical protein
MSLKTPKAPKATPAPAEAAPAPSTATAPTRDVVNQIITTRKRQSTLLANSPAATESRTLLGSTIK